MPYLFWEQIIKILKMHEFIAISGSARFILNYDFRNWLLFAQTVVNLSPEQMELLIRALKELNVIIDGAPNANFDVELLLPSMNFLSVYKRYYLPAQGLLPVIPQVSKLHLLFVT